MPVTAVRFGGLGTAGVALSAVVVGHASAGVTGPIGVLCGLLLVALAVHIVGYGLRDLSEPTPSGPLPAPVAGLVIAATAIASFLIDAVFFGIEPPRGTLAGTIALALTYVSLVASALVRSTFSVVLLGLGWGLLVFYGAARGGGATLATWLAALFVMGYVLLNARLFGPVPLGVLGLVALLSPFGVVGGAGWWIVWYVLALLLTALTLLLRFASSAVAPPSALASAHSPALASTLAFAPAAQDPAVALVAWLPLAAMTAMYGGPWQGFVALAAMAIPTLASPDARASFRTLPSALRTLPTTASALVAKIRPPSRSA